MPGNLLFSKSDRRDITNGEVLKLPSRQISRKFFRLIIKRMYCKGNRYIVEWSFLVTDYDNNHEETEMPEAILFQQNKLVITVRFILNKKYSRIITYCGRFIVKSRSEPTKRILISLIRREKY